MSDYGEMVRDIENLRSRHLRPATTVSDIDCELRPELYGCSTTEEVEELVNGATYTRGHVSTSPHYPNGRRSVFSYIGDFLRRMNLF